MADDTRVTHSRPGYACALALLCACWACCLPAAALASDIIVRRDPGLSAAERADVRADAGVALARMLPLPDTELVTVPAARERPRAGGAERRSGRPLRRAGRRLSRRRSAADSVEPGSGRWRAANDADIDVRRGVGARARAWASTVARGRQGDRTRRTRISPATSSPAGATSSAPRAATRPPRPATTTTARTSPGVIAAPRDNGIGIVGVAPLAHVVPLRALDDCGGGKLLCDPGQALPLRRRPSEIPIVIASFATDPLADPHGARAINDAFADRVRGAPGDAVRRRGGQRGHDNDEVPVYPCSTDARPARRT